MKGAVKAAEITGTTYRYYPLLLILILRSTTKVLQFGEFVRRKFSEKEDLLSIYFIWDSRPPEPHAESLQFHKVFPVSFA